MGASVEARAVSAPMTLLYESRYARLKLDPGRKLVPFVRSEA